MLFGFRVQAFVTRALTAGIAGVGSGSPRVAGTGRRTGHPGSSGIEGIMTTDTAVPLQFTGIRKVFGGVTAVEQFDLEVHSGEIVALVE